MAGEPLMGYLIRIKCNGEDGVYVPVLKNPSCIGRSADCQLRLKDEHVSERHCIIKESKLKKVTIHSLDTNHPVLLNEKEINGEGCPLEEGDIIKISDVRFRWKKAEISENQEEEVFEDARSSFCVEDSHPAGRLEYGRHSAPEFLFPQCGESGEENTEKKIHTADDSNRVVEDCKDVPKQPNENQVLNETAKKVIDVDTNILTEDIPESASFAKDCLETREYFEETHHSTSNPTSNTEFQKETTFEPTDISPKTSAERTPEINESPAKFRGRRSTGVVPCVGTPSDVYRCKRSILTPAIRSLADATSTEIEYGSARRLPRQRSSERKSTPLKSRMSDKSIQRESILHSPIIEDCSLEKCEESQNESTNNDSKYKFVASRRKRRFGGSSFAIENRIAEESETSQNDVTGETVNDLNEEEEESLIALSSCDDSEMPMSARIVINGDTYQNEDELNSTFTIDPAEAEKEDLSPKVGLPLKSILTPLPKAPVSNKEKSIKKVTFARNVIAESFEQSSVNSNRFDDSYDISRQHSGNSIDVSETSSNLCSNMEDGLDSFCKNEELFLSDKLRSSICSQNSTSTPIKSSYNNTSVSCEKLKSVTRSLDTSDKDYELTKTTCNSKNASATSLESISVDDNVDLTALLSCQKEQSVNIVTPNNTELNDKTTEPSVTPNTEQKLNTTANRKSENGLDSFCTNEELSSTDESRPGVSSQKSTSTPMKTTISTPLIANTSTTQSFNTPDKSYELTRTPYNSKDDRFSATSLGGTSMEDNVDLTELMNCKKEQSMTVETPDNTEMNDKTDPNVSSDAHTGHVSKIVTPSKTPVNTPSRSTINASSSSLKTPPEKSSADSAEVATSTKTSTDIETTQSSSILPYTSTPHPTNNSLQHTTAPTESEQISEISEVPHPTITSTIETNSKETCNLPDVAILESKQSSDINLSSDTVEKIEEQVCTKIIKEGLEPRSPIANYSNVEGMKRIFDTPVEAKITYDDVQGVKEIFKTPVDAKVNYEDVHGMKELFKTPCEAKITYEHVEGMRDMFKTPVIDKVTYEDVQGMKQMFKTPVDAKSSYEDVRGMKRIFKTPFEIKSSYENTSGVKQLMKTPRAPICSEENLEGVEDLLKTPHSSQRKLNETVEDMEGFNTLPKSPEASIVSQERENDVAGESQSETIEPLSEEDFSVGTEPVVDENAIFKSEGNEVTTLDDNMEKQSSVDSESLDNAEDSVPCSSILESVSPGQSASQITEVYSQIVEETKSIGTSAEFLPTEEHSVATETVVNENPIQELEIKEGTMQKENEEKEASEDKELLNKTDDEIPCLPIAKSVDSDLSIPQINEDTSRTVEEMKTIRRSARKTPMRLARDNQENEVSYSVGSGGITPGRRRKDTSMKMESSKLHLIKPELRLSKVDLQKTVAETNKTTRTNLFQDDTPTESKRRALRKLDDNSELTQSPSKSVHSNVAESTSRFSIVLPLLDNSSIYRASSGNADSDKQELNAVEVANEKLTVKQRRSSKKRNDRVSQNVDSSATISMPEDHHTGKRTRRQKKSAESNATGSVSSPKTRNSKRATLKTDSAAASQTSTSSQAGSPKLISRKRPHTDKDDISEASPPKRVLRGRRAAIAEEPKAADKRVKGTTRSREKLDEPIEEIDQPQEFRSKRITRAKVTVEPVVKIVDVPENKRTGRSRKKMEVVNTEEKRVTRGTVDKDAPTNKRATKSREMKVEEAESQSSRTSTRSKRNIQETESKSETKKRTGRAVKGKALEEIFETQMSPKPSKTSKKKANTKSACESVVENAKPKRTKVTHSEPKDTRRSKNNESNDKRRSTSRGQSITVSRLSLKLKTVVKRSFAKEDEAASGEPRRKRVRICEPDKSINGESVAESKSSTRSKKSTKAVISKTTTTFIKKTTRSKTVNVKLKSGDEQSTLKKSGVTKNTSATGESLGRVKKIRKVSPEKEASSSRITRRTTRLSTIASMSRTSKKK